MIVLLGASGYVGQAFQRELSARGESVLAISRKQVDYTRYEVLVEFLRDCRPKLLVNAAGFTGRPNVDACELAKADTINGNVLLPLTISHACQTARVPWGHVSSGCIYDGTKFARQGVVSVERDLTQEYLRELLSSHSPDVQGFAERDEPNFTFRSPPCSFYSGSKALAEEALAADYQVYTWRLRMPFDQWDGPRNYLSKLQRYSRIYENFNSLSHRGDYARACLDLFHIGAPFGTYNVTNPGYVSTRQVVELLQQRLVPEHRFEFFANDEEFYQSVAKTPRSNCILDAAKLLSAGVKMRTVEEALEDSIANWQGEPKTVAPSHFPINVPRGVS